MGPIRNGELKDIRTSPFFPAGFLFRTPVFFYVAAPVLSWKKLTLEGAEVTDERIGGAAYGLRQSLDAAGALWGFFGASYCFAGGALLALMTLMAIRFFKLL